MRSGEAGEHYSTMLHLDPIPHDTATLRAALTGALAPLGIGAAALALDGDFPSLAALRLDLTKAKFHRDLRAKAGKGETGGKPAFFAREVSVNATPAFLETLPFTLALRGTDAVFALAGSSLSLAQCGAGTLDIAVKHADLEAALTAVAREAAEKKGADIKSVKVELKANGPRALELRAVAVAKAMFLTATLTITGRVEVSDAMEVRLSGLGCTGDGMLANMAAGSLRPRLAAMEGRSLDLRSLVPNLRSISLDATAGLRIHAEFGA